MNWDTIAAILLSLFTLVAVMLQARSIRNDAARTAEDKGRLLQRVDDLERRMAEQEKKAACADDNHSESATKIATLEAKLDGIKEQLDALTRAVNDLASRMPR